MDPLTQGIFGSLFAQVYGKTKDLAKALVIGGIAGMTPDLDVLIRSAEDPLLALEYHRHFTHSLFFIPLGALFCSLILHPTLGRILKVRFLQTLMWCLFGVASHGFVDALTSYGTLLFWPFFNERIAWDIVSIIDPLVTLPLIGLVTLAAIKKKRSFTIAAFSWISLYLGLSLFQHHRAIEQGEMLAALRGIDIVKIEAKPSFSNIMVWKVISTTEDKFYVDAVKVGWGEPVIWHGDSINKLSVERDFSWLDEESQQRKDIERFRWFSSGYVAQDKNNPNRIVDMRYSLLPQKIQPLCGIELLREGDQ